MKGLEDVIGINPTIDNPLKGNSFNCKFTIAKNNLTPNMTYFIKVQVNPNKDNINIDNVVGKILQEIYNITLQTRTLNKEWLLCKYVGCCHVKCKIDPGDIYNITLDPQIKPPYIKSICNVQEALQDPVALYDVLMGLDDKLLLPALDYICKLFKFMSKMGKEYSFVHNDAHLGNIQYSKKTGELYLIDMGRVGIRIPKGLTPLIDLDKIIEDVITDTTINLTADELLEDKIEIWNDITNMPDCFVCPSQYSFVFDISTIVMNVLEILYNRNLLYTYVQTVKTHIPAFVFGFQQTEEKGEKIDYITVNQPHILTQISEYLTPGIDKKLPNPNIPIFVRYLITGLSVLATIAIENCMYNTEINNDNVLFINFTKLLQHKIMYRSYQYIYPINESLALMVYNNSYRSIAEVRRPARQKTSSPLKSDSIPVPKSTTNSLTVVGKSLATSEKSKTSLAPKYPKYPKTPQGGGTYTHTETTETTIKKLNSKLTFPVSIAPKMPKSQTQCEIEVMQYEAYTKAWTEALKDPESVRRSPPKPPTGYSWNIEKKQIAELKNEFKKKYKPVIFPNQNDHKDVVSNVDISTPDEKLVKALKAIQP